jgi:hypothetical protein
MKYHEYCNYEKDDKTKKLTQKNLAFVLQCLQIFASYVWKMGDFKALFVVSWCTLPEFLVLSFCNICISYLIPLSIETFDVNICYLFLHLIHIDYWLPHTHLSNFSKSSTKKIQRNNEIPNYICRIWKL